MTQKNKKKPRPGSTAWVSYIHPFQLIVPDGEKPMDLTLDEVNSNRYDHEELCRIVGILDVLDLARYKMLVCYDGALAIPMCDKYRHKEMAVDIFNKIICQLLLGGILCEAIDQKDVVGGWLYEQRLIWPVNIGESNSSQMNARLRFHYGSHIDLIILSKPRSLAFSEFKNALDIGSQYLRRIPNLTPTFLVRGITEMRYKNWSLSLSNLWITIEQLTDHLWNSSFMGNPLMHPKNNILGRSIALKQDNRTWSSSVKQELLYQTKILDDYTFERLYPGRQARNNLVHDGKQVDQKIVLGVCEALLQMMRVCCEEVDLPLEKLEFIPERFYGERVDFQEDFSDWEELSNCGSITTLE